MQLIPVKRSHTPQIFQDIQAVTYYQVSCCILGNHLHGLEGKIMDIHQKKSNGRHQEDTIFHSIEPSTHNLPHRITLYPRPNNNVATQINKYMEEEEYEEISFRTSADSQTKRKGPLTLDLTNAYFLVSIKQYTTLHS